MSSSNYGIEKQGFLYKTSLYLKQTRKRWIELQGKYLICKHNRKITEKIDLTSFNDVKFSNKIAGQFELINGKTNQKRIFRADPAKEMYDWAQHILRVIYSHQLFKLKQKHHNKKDDKKYGSNNQFEHYSASPQRHKIDNDIIDISDSTQNGYTATHSTNTLTPIHYIDNDNDRDYHNQINDGYHKAKTIKESQLMEILKERHIIFDSLISVYSQQKKLWINYAAILTKHHLCLISATNYKIWKEFTEKSKIEELMNMEHNNDRNRINNEMALKLTENMNITDDIKKINRIKSCLCHRTKKRMKLNILLNEKNISSLSCLFGVDEYEQSIKDIPGGGDDNLYRFSDHKLKIIELRRLNKVIPITNNNGYQFLLELADESKILRHDKLICRLDSNNLRFEWISHIDYVKYVGHYKHYQFTNNNNDNDKYKNKKCIDKFMNDFDEINEEKEKKEDEFSYKFNFGEYLNYWQHDYENSVIPKYCTLKEELLNNEISKISKKDYYFLYKTCARLHKLYGYKYKAQNIGINNEIFKIYKGAAITINHLIALKLYTDFSNIQNKFKLNCRRSNDKETMKELIHKNKEIAHWSRYLKECCTFYAKLMKKKDILYTGLKNKLLFGSLKQFFHCPLSTTISSNIAQGFCDDHGIILKLKAANTKTRYFDVSWLSHFQHEEERLIMGSSLQIIDIYINGMSQKTYVAALQMLEQIIDGQFIFNIKLKTEQKLYNVMLYLLGQRNENENENEREPPKYIIALFKNMINRMKKENKCNSLWINKDTLKQIKHQKLKLLFNEFFNYFGIITSNIQWVQQFEWKIDLNIDDNKYNKLQKEEERLYIKSSPYHYIIDQYAQIGFHFEFCYKYSNESKKCALFVYLDTLPINVNAIRIQYDLLCDYGVKNKYEEITEPQWLSHHVKSCGFQAFSMNKINKASILWYIGMKIIEIKYYDSNNSIKDMQTTKEFKLLIQQNIALQSVNNELIEENTRLNQLVFNEKSEKLMNNAV